MKADTPLAKKLTAQQLKQNQKIAQALEKVVDAVRQGEVHQMCVAVVMRDGSANTAVVTANDGFVTMVGALEMCKLEVVAENAPDDTPAKAQPQVSDKAH